MRKGIPIRPGDFPVGKPIPHSVYDHMGNLLLRKGFVLSSSKQRDRLLRRGLVRFDDPSDEQALLAEQHLQPTFDGHEKFTVFEALETLISRLTHAYRILRSDARHLFPFELGRIALDIQQLCHDNPSAILGAMQLTPLPYSIMHPLHAAVLCDILARHLGYSQMQRLPLVAGAASHDVGIHQLQEALHRQREPLSEEQWDRVRSHPQLGVELLKRAGVDDPKWLEVIAQHHERLDGSGYPKGLSGEQISRESRILAIADIYSAMIRPKEYRNAHVAQSALRTIFQERGSTIDPELVNLFIRRLGIFPPGGFVRLKNGEVAVVKETGGEPRLPRIVSLLASDGTPMAQPRERDPREASFAIVEMLPVREHPAVISHLNQLWPPVDPIATV